MGPNETNPVLRAMDHITEDMVKMGTERLQNLIRRGMKRRFAWQAVMGSVTLEVFRLKNEMPTTDVGKLVDEIEHVRAKVRRALVDSMFEAAKKYDPDLALEGRDIEWEEYLGENLKPEDKRR